MEGIIPSHSGPPPSPGCLVVPAAASELGPRWKHSTQNPCRLLTLEGCCLALHSLQCEGLWLPWTGHPEDGAKVPGKRPHVLRRAPCLRFCLALQTHCRRPPSLSRGPGCENLCVNSPNHKSLCQPSRMSLWLRCYLMSKMKTTF